MEDNEKKNNLNQTQSGNIGINQVEEQNNIESKKAVDSKTIASFVCGIISVVFALICYFVLGFLSFPALILGIFAIVYGAKEFKTNKFGLVGLITGVIGTVLSAIGVILYIIALIAISSV